MKQHRTHAFMLRLWREELDADHSEWRGQVRHVLSAEVHYFRQWEDLIAFVRKILEDGDDADDDAKL